MTAKQNTDNRYLKFWHWKKVRSASEKVKKWKIADISPKIYLIDLWKFELFQILWSWRHNYTYRSQRAKFEYSYWYRRNYSEVFLFRSGIKDIPENNV